MCEHGRSPRPKRDGYRMGLEALDTISDVLGASRAAARPGFGDIVTSVFTPLIANHYKSFSIIDRI